jgi:hypothetical protein
MSPGQVRSRFFPVIGALAMLAQCAAAAILAAPGTESSSATNAAPRAISLDAWRSLKKSAEEINQLPQGPERIARCEAFLKAHPEYPDAYAVLSLLVNDLRESPNADPAYIAGLVERMVETRTDFTGMSAVYLVDRYLMKYQPVPEGADRLLARSRKEIEKSRGLLQKDPVPVLSGSQESPDYGEFWILLDEGRILLSRGNASGALKKLREAEQLGTRTGQFVVLRAARGNGKDAKVLDTGSQLRDWLNLSMAAAHARLGDKAAARERLERVVAANGFDADFTARLEKLRSDLEAPAPGKTVIRADPEPAPDFSLQDLEGKKVSLSDYRGRVVLVMLWTTW